MKKRAVVASALVAESIRRTKKSRVRGKHAVFCMYPHDGAVYAGAASGAAMRVGAVVEKGNGNVYPNAFTARERDLLLKAAAKGDTMDVEFDGYDVIVKAGGVVIRASGMPEPPSFGELPQVDEEIFIPEKDVKNFGVLSLFTGDPLEREVLDAIHAFAGTPGAYVASDGFAAALFESSVATEVVIPAPVTWFPFWKGGPVVIKRLKGAYMGVNIVDSGGAVFYTGVNNKHVGMADAFEFGGDWKVISISKSDFRRLVDAFSYGRIGVLVFDGSGNVAGVLAADADGSVVYKDGEWEKGAPYLALDGKDVFSKARRKAVFESVGDACAIKVGAWETNPRMYTRVIVETSPWKFAIMGYEFGSVVDGAAGRG